MWHVSSGWFVHSILILLNIYGAFKKHLWEWKIIQKYNGIKTKYCYKLEFFKTKSLLLKNSLNQFSNCLTNIIQQKDGFSKY